MQRILFLFTLSCFAINARAQTGTWSSAGIDFKHNNKWESEIQLIQRFNPNGWTKGGVSLTESYSPLKYIALGLQYRWTMFPNEKVYLSDSPFDNGNRIQFSIDWKLVRSKKEQNRFEISWRNAIQLERLNGARNPLICRSRIKISSPEWRKMRINARAEYFYWSNAVQYWNDSQLIQYGLSKEWRYSASLEMKLNSKNKFQFGFCYSNRLMKQDRQWCTFSFNHEIKRKKEGSKKTEALPVQE